MDKRVEEFVECVRLKDDDVVCHSKKTDVTKGGVGITAKTFKNQCFANVSKEDINENIEKLLNAQIIKILTQTEYPLALVVDRGLPKIPDFRYDKEKYRPSLKRGAINYLAMLGNYRKVILLSEALKEGE